MARAIRTISAFKSKLAGGAARPNLFEVEIPSFPAFVAGDWDNETREKFELHGKGSSITCF